MPKSWPIVRLSQSLGCLEDVGMTPANVEPLSTSLAQLLVERVGEDV